MAKYSVLWGIGALSTHVELVNNDGIEIQYIIENSPNPSVFITIPQVCQAGHILIAVNYRVIRQMLWV
jgi:hypothetical protein